MKIKVSEATGPVLDWLVAKSLYGDRLVHYRTWLETTNNHWKGRDCSSFAADNEFRILSKDRDGVSTETVKAYSTEETLVVSLIEQEKIDIIYHHITDTVSAVIWIPKQIVVEGPTMLIAAMRCFVIRYLGEEVEVPEELFK